MIILKLILALLFPIIIGYTVLSMASKENDLFPLEKLALSYGIGIGLLSLIIFFMGALGLPLKTLSILTVCPILFAYPLFTVIQKFKFPRLSINTFKEKLDNIKWYEWIMLCVIALRIFYSYLQALIKPVGEIDSVVYRMMRAKVFFIEQGLSLSKTKGYFFGSPTHIYYPINIELFVSWIYNVLGTWNDVLIKIIFPTFLLALAIIFYYSIKRIASRPASLFSVYLLLTLPLLIHHSSTTYIDAVVGFYFFSSFVFLLLFIRTSKISYLLISALLAGICLWTKNDGMPLALVNIIILSFSLAFINKQENKDKLKYFATYLTPILLFSVPWNIFKIVHNVPSPHEIPNFLKIFEYSYRIPVILKFYYEKSLFYGNWNIAWLVFIIVIIVSIIRKRFYWENILVLIAIILSMAAFGSVYCLSKNAYPFLLDSTIQNRNFLTFMALVIYYICISIFRKSENILESKSEQ